VELNYRMFTPADEPELIDLWSNSSGWDRVDAEAWAHRLIYPPLGAAEIVVAEDRDTDRIVGQFAYIPSLVSVDGQEVKALRPFAPILSEALRTGRIPNPLTHPVIAMYRFGVSELRARGHGLIYMIPDPRWVLLFRFFPFLQTGQFPLWSLPLPLSSPFQLPNGFSTGELAGWDQRVDRLWAQARNLHGCSVVRDSRILPWKIGSGDYTVTQVERDGELVGLVASRHKGDRQWLICDLIAAEGGDSLRATLMAACNVGHDASRNAPPGDHIEKAAVLVTPPMRPALTEIGFQRDDYDFSLAVHILDKSLDKSLVSPERWYLSAND
jgi:hypothetical protein